MFVGGRGIDWNKVMSAWNKSLKHLVDLLYWPGKKKVAQARKVLDLSLLSTVWEVICLLCLCLRKWGGSFCFVTGNAMIHAKRSLTSGLINHFFSSLSFRVNTFLLSSHSLLLLLSLSPNPATPPPQTALLVISLHSGMPHHPYHSSLLICSLICLDGCRRRRDENESDWGVESSKERKERVWERKMEQKKEVQSCKSSLMKSVCMPFNS